MNFQLNLSVELKEYSVTHFKNDYIETKGSHKVKRPEITKQCFYEV